MRKNNNNSLLLTIMGGAIFCFVFLGLAFVFTNNTKIMKGNNSSTNQITNEEISLGDECSTYCATGTKIGNDTSGYYCYSDVITSWDGGTGSCEGYVANNTCYRTRSEVTGTICTSCSYGKYLDSNNQCQTCHAGSECSDGIHETACPAGKYSEAPGQIGCASCANLDNGAVRYQPSTGQTSCLTCTGNQVANAAHTACVSNTVTCNNGEYEENGECHPCQPGYYCNGTGMIPCPKGTAASTTAVRTACPACTGNQYQDETGKTTCKTCSGTVNDNHTVCNLNCSQRTMFECAQEDSCEWNETTNKCQDKPKECSKITDKTECQGRSDCAWDTAWTTYCHDKPATLTTLEVTPTAEKVFVAINKPVTVYYIARDENGNEINVSWSTPDNSLVTRNCTGTTLSRCSYTFNSNACEGSYSVTITATDISGIQKSSTITARKYDNWTLASSGKKEMPNGITSQTRDAMMFKEGCIAYEGTYQENGKWYYTEKWNRCCGSGSGDSSACYVKTACYKKPDNTYVWTDNPEYTWEETTITKIDDCQGLVIAEGDYTRYTWTSTPEPSWTKISSIKSATSCVKTPACYYDEDDTYYWTNTPEPDWIKVPGISKDADCKGSEDEACYIDTNGQYQWGKFAKTTGYTLVTSITDSDLCPPKEESACYRVYLGSKNYYVWSDTAPEGYEKVEGVTDPKDCGEEELPACYLKGNEFVWGKYDKVTGYIKIEDIDNEEDCARPTDEACYVDLDGEYHWGDYSDNAEYSIVASITEQSKCKADVPVPATGISVSKLIYIFMAILMACGVGFIYYSSVLKKNN